MQQPILVILAAGMGSRYGGLKQMDPIGPNGELIIDYSLHDAYQAGFRRVVFIIKEEIEADFKEIIGNRMSDYFEVQYAYQNIHDLPEPFKNPEERIKPWGTSHALLAASDLIDAPFCVINADDFYGKQAYQIVYQELQKMIDQPAKKKPQYIMIGYQLMKTLSKFGHVARGICEVDSSGRLKHIVERTKIIEKDNLAFYTEDDETWHQLSDDTIVSMNFWGFDPSLIDFLKAEFPSFLEQAMVENPLKGEFLLPNSVGNLIDEDKADVLVKTSADQWYGVTYQKDKPQVEKEIVSLIEAGKYNSPLWENMND
ncbi:MAG: NTP transferase domain-containing protein [Clostridiaceae bacterium]|nr:NTP transferase domain-containing protein [Clostridiaceae bacterium]